ncbi:alpha/beta fold hydrolase [Planctomonas sp. JC2975]|uniref:alpha/beta fold hydrolase n=1 Tax=Planctomonas sp. JC2975 TaxID=2729626 RepID=UPI0014738E3D|nr:alpha/beta fold hydrolase [Planctomonas sp. JC2975]NNC13169.1 alpha/beta fold hydrolase [Planctomonas sp. JC2975]
MTEHETAEAARRLGVAARPGSDPHPASISSDSIEGAVAGDGDGRELFLSLAAGELHVVVAGPQDAPALVLIHGTASDVHVWDPIVPSLTAEFRVIRVDLLGHGRSTPSTDGYGILAQARRIGEALDRLDAGRVSVVAHSMGCLVATALAEARPDLVCAVGLIDGGPDLEAAAPDGPAFTVLLAPGIGRFVWALRTEGMVRAAAASAVTRDVELPNEMVRAAIQMTYPAFVGTDRAARDYLEERDLPSRLVPLGLPLLVLFGDADKRWSPSAASAYLAVPGARLELLPGVGHTPMLEDTAETVRLLRRFLSQVAAKGDRAAN